ncbi:hypothetical protein [Ferrovibrio sp.]|uniref:hypothetical protein n=1 Tax=Ferrovibrio sp. TaxID=1917215 RepID=UPI000CAF4A61|nr:hypothetical protein [Ferrovibrio sp.]PJI37304.1 MAG: hypothetical protein CTR53_20800 [Ferrovibrio sp.]
MLYELSWDAVILPMEARNWRADVERASGLSVRLLRDDEMAGAEGEAWSEPGLRAVVLAGAPLPNAMPSSSDTMPPNDVMTIVHELGHLKLETQGWPHCYLCHEDARWIEWHYGLISDLVSLIEHQSFFPAMLRMGLDAYAASEADLADADVLDELRNLAPSLPLPGLKPDWAITMQLLRALLECRPDTAEAILRDAAQLGPEVRMARALAAIVRAAPPTPQGFAQAMRDCWRTMGFADETLCIGEEEGEVEVEELAPPAASISLAAGG